ncbi:MAG: ABC transporter ATP-binding protein [Deltaproteobacteria bacterium]|nr:ABC transporter ATP-binding protein [Deltaproteobacteria bacterium]
MIELVDVRKVYTRGDSQTVAVDGISLTVAKGEFVSIMGPSGSGKSTMLHLIGALDTPTSGDVVLAGESTAKMGEHALTLFRRQRLGFVFQFFNLLPTMSALENAALPALLNGVPRAQAMERAKTLLDTVGLGKRLDHRPEQLSGGEMQRVAIARALVNTPVVLLADEPTGNLDSTTGAEVLRMLHETTRAKQVTLVMVTHDPSAAKIGDRIIRLKDGRVVTDAA